MKKKIFITGGAGYVGCHLADYLVEIGHDVTVYDLFIYGKDVFKFPEKINCIKGDIRDIKNFDNSVKNHEIVIHLACISNDPSFEMNPKLGKSINLDAFEPMVKSSIKNGVSRFIYASSSSVYGIKSEKNVNEEMTLEPLTDYSKFKADCETILMKYKSDYFETAVIRPATVCGYSKRQRLDVIVNILTNLAYHKKEILVLGGEQLRPNIHINDMVRSYELIINAEKKLINGQIFNAGWENKSVNEIAKNVQDVIGSDVKITKKETNDDRSYHISSEKIKKILNFKTNFTIKDAVIDLKKAFVANNLQDPLTNEIYFNIKRMKNINLI
jgi:nucleoside-diphosphate-sugar epimerase